MSRLCCLRLIVLSGLVIGTIGVSSPALAWKQFGTHWKEVYLEDHEDKEYAEMVSKKAKCHLCHQGRKKKHNNPYGKEFEGLIGKEDRKDDEKIVKAIKEVGKRRSDPDDHKSPLYDELIAQGKLPGCSLEDAKKEPKKPKDSKAP